MLRLRTKNLIPLGFACDVKDRELKFLNCT